MKDKIRQAFIEKWGVVPAALTRRTIPRFNELAADDPAVLGPTWRSGRPEGRDGEITVLARAEAFCRVSGDSGASYPVAVVGHSPGPPDLTPFVRAGIRHFETEPWLDGVAVVIHVGIDTWPTVRGKVDPDFDVDESTTVA